MTAFHNLRTFIDRSLFTSICFRWIGPDLTLQLKNKRSGPLVLAPSYGSERPLFVSISSDALLVLLSLLECLEAKRRKPQFLGILHFLESNAVFSAVYNYRYITKAKNPDAFIRFSFVSQTRLS